MVETHELARAAPAYPFDISPIHEPSIALMPKSFDSRNVPQGSSVSPRASSPASLSNPKWSWTTLLMVVLVVGLSIALNSRNAAVADELIVGSLNCEWFGDIEKKPRTEKQIQTFAKFIDSTKADVFCVQEISEDGDSNRNGRADWDELQSALGPAWKGYLGDTGGGQRLGVLWRRAKVDLSDFGEVNTLRRENVNPSVRTFPRIPFTFYVKTAKGALDFRVVVVHLFAGEEIARPAECDQLRDWYGRLVKAKCDPDVLMIGDFNTYALAGGHSPELDAIEKDDTLVAISRNHQESTQVRSRRRLDQAVLSKPLLEHHYVPKSYDVLREVVETFPENYADTISDHVPILLRLSIPEKDVDDIKAGDWGDDQKDPR